MSVTVPYNEERAQRCKDLANDIANDQLRIGQVYDKLEYQNSDKGLIAALDKIAKAAKVTGITELKDKALKAMSEEDRKYIQALQEQLTKDGKTINMELQIAGAIGGVGAVLSPQTWAVLTKLLTGMRVIAMYATQAFRGMQLGAAALAALNVVRNAMRTMATAAANGIRAGLPGARALGAVARAVSLGAGAAKMAANVLAVVGILATIAGFIADAIIGTQARDELRKMINELVPKRFAVKRMQVMQDKTLYIKEKVLAILYWKVDMDEFVSEGMMPKEVIQKKLEEKFGSMVEPLVLALDEITDQGILDELANKDRSANSWTKEDPGLDHIKAWLEKNETMDVDTKGEIPPAPTVGATPAPSATPAPGATPAPNPPKTDTKPPKNDTHKQK